MAATALWDSSDGRRIQLLTKEERARLAAISSIVRFRKGTQIYRQGDRADAAFIIVSGVAKPYRTLPGGTEHIVAFLFPDDAIGLMEEGHYMNSAKAVTAVTAYRIPITPLAIRLRTDPDLEFHVICKLAHELREAQRHAFLLSKHSALTKLVMFLQMMEDHQATRGESTEEVHLPMSRSDIGNYVGMSLEAVSRSFGVLQNRGVIAFRNRQHVKITDRALLEGIASQGEARGHPHGRAAPAAA